MHPEDGRNRTAARAADRIADYIEAIPDNDPRLIKLQRVWDIAGDHKSVADRMVEELDVSIKGHGASRIGFQGGPPSEPSAWLDNYVSEHWDVLVRYLTFEAD